MKKILYLRNNKDMRMITDPYRLKILQIIMKNEKISLTVQEIANKLGDPHGKVYYHVKKLADYGALEIHKTENINGITAKYYKLTFDDIDFGKDPENKSNYDFKVNQAMKMVAQFYNDSRDDYLKSIKRYAENNKGKENEKAKDDCFIYLSNVYLNDEIFPKFKADVIELIKKYSTKGNNDVSHDKKGVFLAVYPEFDD
ncbi:helix-turn-helix domain-containing protein [Clostridiaceae bacterium M8S5]|nr:helix-turn-helix domain-containing protein [Clostridiaceae bacterium M8S5]